MAEPGWKPDPNGRHEWRYFDGVSWTDKVSDAGNTATDAYDPEVVPPPPDASPAQVAAAARPKRVIYKLHLLDRKNNEIFSAPFQSPDMAIRHAEQNPELRMKHTLGSVLWKGALAQNVVAWRTAVIMEIDQDTGEATEYHRLTQR